MRRLKHESVCFAILVEGVFSRRYFLRTVLCVLWLCDVVLLGLEEHVHGEIWRSRAAIDQDVRTAKRMRDEAKMYFEATQAASSLERGELW